MEEKSKERVEDILWRIEGKIDIIGQMIYDKLVEDIDEEEDKKIVNNDKEKGFKPKID